MMIKTLILGAITAFSLMGAMPAQAALEIGKPAPDFTATDSTGKTHKLSDYKGKIVVLEWNNPECPFVKKHYDSGNMQKLQETYTAKDVIWLTINSGSAGKQGYLDAAAANKYLADEEAKPTAYLLDSAGEIGKAYGAKVTPQMVVIYKDGALAYDGAIDDNDSANPDTIAGSKNYVTAAIDDLNAGGAVKISQSKPYGCGVKY